MDPASLKMTLHMAMQELFGLVYGAIHIDVLDHRECCDGRGRRLLLQVDRSALEQVSQTMAVISLHHGRRCTFRIRDSTPYLPLISFDKE